MKVIKLPSIKTDDPDMDAHGLIYNTLKFTPRGCNIDEMRRRIRIMNVLEGRKNPLVLEDADFDLMKATFFGFQGFGMVSAEALAVADAIDAAVTPPVAGPE